MLSINAMLFVVGFLALSFPLNSLAKSELLESVGKYSGERILYPDPDSSGLPTYVMPSEFKPGDWEALANNVFHFVETWCSIGVPHEVCYAEDEDIGSIQVLTLQFFFYKNHLRGSHVFDPNLGATGLMLLTGDDQYLRAYMNAEVSNGGGSGGKYADGSAGYIFPEGRGINSLWNFNVYFYPRPKPVSEHGLGIRNQHRGWASNIVATEGDLLTLQSPSGNFKETWRVTRVEDLDDRALSMLGLNKDDGSIARDPQQSPKELEVSNRH